MNLEYWLQPEALTGLGAFWRRARLRLGDYASFEAAPRSAYLIDLALDGHVLKRRERQ
jgi:hypothetical protein